MMQGTREKLVRKRKGSSSEGRAACARSLKPSRCLGAGTIHQRRRVKRRQRSKVSSHKSHLLDEVRRAGRAGRGPSFLETLGFALLAAGVRRLVVLWARRLSKGARAQDLESRVDLSQHLRLALAVLRCRHFLVRGYLFGVVFGSARLVGLRGLVGLVCLREGCRLRHLVRRVAILRNFRRGRAERVSWWSSGTLQRRRGGLLSGREKVNTICC